MLTSKRDLDCINFQNSVVEKSPEKQSSLIEKSEMISEANLQAAKGQNDVEKKIDAAMLSMNRLVLYRAFDSINDVNFKSVYDSQIALCRKILTILYLAKMRTIIMQHGCDTSGRCAGDYCCSTVMLGDVLSLYR